jgi:lipoprotein-releasing system ATP-binding protein
MSDIIVGAKNIVKNYTSAAETLYILRGLNFEIERGASVAITGPSGSGKSTLLNILGGLDRLDSGELFVAGKKIDNLNEKHLSRYRRTSVGFIFQFHYLLKDFSALENVMLPAYIAGMTKKAAIKKAEALLDGIGMTDRASHLPNELSGGERQRVAVARAMINDPDIILADEPTGNLDPKHSGVVAELLYTEAEKRGKTLIVVTHDETVAARAKWRYTLENGLLTEHEN